MAGQYLETYFTPEVNAAQAQYYEHPQAIPPQPEPDPLGVQEMEFIGRRDSF